MLGMIFGMMSLVCYIGFTIDTRDSSMGRGLGTGLLYSRFKPGYGMVYKLLLLFHVSCF